MKITPKQYARLRMETTEGKPEERAKEIIGELVRFLARNNDAGKSRKIIEQFGELWNRKKGIVEAEITGAKEFDKETVKLLNNYIVGLSGAKEIELKQKVDKSILGGAIIKYGDKVVDGSLKTRLLSLKERMIK